MRLTKSVVVLAVLGVAGCGGKAERSDVVTAVPKAEAEELGAQHARFEGSKDPKPNAATHFAAGQLAESQGAVGQAIVQYKHAVAADPKHLPSLYRLAMLYTQAEAYPEAIGVWKGFVKVTPNDATAWSNLGYCYELAGQPTEAEAAYKQGIAKDPKSGPCRVNYGLMLARTGREEESKGQLGAVLTPARVCYNLASVYEQQGKKGEAKLNYERALELDAELGEARERLAKLGDS